PRALTVGGAAVEGGPRPASPLDPRSIHTVGSSMGNGAIPKGVGFGAFTRKPLPTGIGLFSIPSLTGAEPDDVTRRPSTIDRTSLMQLRKLVVGVAVFGLAISAGIAYASVPDSNKTVHGCWKAAAAANGTHKLTVIDTATTPACPSGFNSLNWSTKGQLLYENIIAFARPYTASRKCATLR